MNDILLGDLDNETLVSFACSSNLNKDTFEDGPDYLANLKQMKDQIYEFNQHQDYTPSTLIHKLHTKEIDHINANINDFIVKKNKVIFDDIINTSTIFKQRLDKNRIGNDYNNTWLDRLNHSQYLYTDLKIMVVNGEHEYPIDKYIHGIYLGAELIPLSDPDQQPSTEIPDLKKNSLDMINGDQLKVLRHLYGINDQYTIPFYFCKDGNVMYCTQYQDQFVYISFKNNNNIRLKISISMYGIPNYNPNPALIYRYLQCPLVMVTCVTVGIPTKPKTIESTDYVTTSYDLIPRYYIWALLIKAKNNGNSININNMIIKGLSEDLKIIPHKLERYDDYYVIRLYHEPEDDYVINWTRYKNQVTIDITTFCHIGTLDVEIFGIGIDLHRYVSGIVGRVLDYGRYYIWWP